MTNIELLYLSTLNDIVIKNQETNGSYMLSRKKCALAEDAVQCATNFKIKKYCNNCLMGLNTYINLFVNDQYLSDESFVKKYKKIDKSKFTNKRIFVKFKKETAS